LTSVAAVAHAKFPTDNHGTNLCLTIFTGSEGLPTGEISIDFLDKLALNALSAHSITRQYRGSPVHEREDFRCWILETR